VGRGVAFARVSIDDPNTLQIDCAVHGRSIAASVCGHVVGGGGVALGFVENSDDPADLQGWCFACEYVFEQEQDRTPRFRSFCQHSIVCVDCYRDIKAKHSFAD